MYVLDIDSLQRYFPCGHTHDTPHNPQSVCSTPQGISPLVARSTDLQRTFHLTIYKFTVNTLKQEKH